MRISDWSSDVCSSDLSRFEELVEREQFILTVCANGYGKLSSASEYRRTGRGGQGVTNIDNTERNGPVVDSFPPRKEDHLMHVTDHAKVIRMGPDSLTTIARTDAGERRFKLLERGNVVGAAQAEHRGTENR